MSIVTKVDTVHGSGDRVLLFRSVLLTINTDKWVRTHNHPEQENCSVAASCCKLPGIELTLLDLAVGALHMKDFIHSLLQLFKIVLVKAATLGN